ncbi:TetR/AcrR family transcriptional regulator [Sinimarinibacterium flocculans]|uniref:TetR/AcrR family transcriptional regulator n=1 Tax=Sinimarinibacterium flocculans TaxID=985250 RepID=UPI003519CB08
MAQRKAEEAAGGEDATSTQLVLAALELFAQHGIEAVALSRIREAVGAANRSAVHYHFRNKTGLVKAVMERVAGMLAPLQNEALAELEMIRRRRRPKVREIVAIGFSPFVALFQQSREGMLAVRFLSRLTWESGSEAQALLVRTLRPYFEKLTPMFSAAMPDKPVEAIGFHGYLAVNNLIHGLSDITLLTQEPTYGVDKLYREQPELMLEYFYDYLSAGMASKVGPASPR